MLKTASRRVRGQMIPYNSGRDAGLVPVEYTYSSDGDANGVFYALGTNFGAVSWGNPILAGRLAVSMLPGWLQGYPADLTDRTSSSAVSSTLDNTNNAIKFDLGVYRALILKKYSLRNRNDVNATIATNVTVSGSNDDSSWTSLVTTAHVAGTSVWNSITVTPAEPFRFIRFHSNANNSNNGYMTAGEIELYGTFFVSP